MPDKKNLFCASNPARLIDALWRVLTDGNHTDFADDIIFLPSRRAVRTIEKMIADHAGGAVMLPRLVALGEASDDEDEFAGGEFESTDNSLPPVALAKGGAQSTDVVSNLERTIMLSKMLSAQMNVGIAGAMPVAKDLIRMMDYLENENPGRDFNLDWSTLVGDQYAEHFRDKAQFLDVACRALPLVFPGRETVAQKRNRDILSWIEYLRMKDEGRKMTEKSDSNHPSSIIHHPSKIIVCGSTASVPATAALMAFIAGLDNGYIIFPGIPPQRGGADVVGEGGVPVTNPYYSEMHFLKRIGAAPGDVQRIDVGDSKIGFFNAAFENNFKIPSSIVHHPSSVRIDCARESEEAEVAAEIATDAASSGKSVLIITPDAAGNQRLRESFARRGVIADFSGGVSAAVAPWGRAVLNRIDIEIKSARRAVAVKDLFGMVSDFDLEFSESDAPTIEKIKEASDVLQNNGIVLDLTDVRAVAAEAMASVQIRPPMTDDCKISVLGTIESRMQTADVVILTGLNEGMFPALGYENPWLPRRVADTIGLPPPERKVSLMAMDFMTLSCGPVVYWTRSKMSGGGETTESRFLSRVSVADVGARTPAPGRNYAPLQNGEQWLARVRGRDRVAPAPLDAAAPTPPADWSDVYVTDLEFLIHNPYAFYCRHLLRLKHAPDPWDDTTAIDFGNLVHDAIEQLTVNSERLTVNDIVNVLDEKAKDKLEPGSVMFHFWHKRFAEMAPIIKDFIDEISADDVVWSAAENEARGELQIENRTIRAKADRVYLTKDKTGVVVDIKTGALPSNAQLNDGMMPQLPLEALMLSSGKFKGQSILPARVIMKFLSLARGKCGMVEYDGDDLNTKMDAATQKTKEQFDQFSAGGAPYVYRETTIKKYRDYDDLARVDD